VLISDDSRKDDPSSVHGMWASASRVKWWDCLDKGGMCERYKAQEICFQRRQESSDSERKR
jgi:hypothetical protein